MYSNYYIALDFDGTLVEHNFPHIGKTKRNTINLLKRKRDEINRRGQTLVLILWTCRSDKYLDDAKEWCESNLPDFLIPKYYNENPEVPMNSNKIFANEYWDDRAVNIQ